MSNTESEQCELKEILTGIQVQAVETEIQIGELESNEKIAISS